MSENDDRPTAADVIDKVNELLGKKVTKVVEKTKKKIQKGKGKKQTPQEEAKSIEAQVIIEEARIECDHWPVDVAAKYMWEERNSYIQKHDGKIPQTWEQLLNEEGYEGPSRRYLVSNFGKFNMIMGALEFDLEGTMEMLRGDSQAFVPEEELDPLATCAQQSEIDTHPDPRFAEPTLPYAEQPLKEAVPNSGFPEPEVEDVPDSLGSAVNSVLNGEIVTDNVPAVVESPAIVESVEAEQKVKVIDAASTLPPETPQKTPAEILEEKILGPKEKDTVSVDGNEYEVVQPVEAADNVPSLNDDKKEAPALLSSDYFELEERTDGMSPGLPPGGGTEVLESIFDDTETIAESGDKPIYPDFEETSPEMPALQPEEQPKQEVKPIPDLSEPDEDPTLEQTPEEREEMTALTRNGAQDASEKREYIREVSEDETQPEEPKESTAVVVRPEKQNGNGIDGLQNMLESWEEKHKHVKEQPTEEKPAEVDLEKPGSYLLAGEKIPNQEDDKPEFATGGGSGGGGGGSYDDRDKKSRFGIFAGIATFTIAGLIGLYALLSDNNGKGAEDDKVPAKEETMQHKAKPEFESEAWENTCRVAATEDIRDLVREDHPLSKNHDYNLSSDGKKVISNQGVINAAYWYGTRKFGKGVMQWWRGGYGTERQKDMATKWLAQYGIDIDDLIANRSTEFDGSLVSTDMVHESVVEECRAPDDAVEPEKVPATPDVEYYEDADPDKGAFNMIHDGMIKTVKAKVAEAQEAKLDDMIPIDVEEPIDEDEELVPIRFEEPIEESAWLDEQIPIDVEEPVYDDNIDDEVSLDVELTPDSFAPEDREAIADTFKDAYFGKAMPVENIAMFYKGVTPELAKQIYAEQMANDPEYDDDYIPITETDPMTEIEYKIKEIDETIAELTSPEHEQRHVEYVASLDSLEKDMENTGKMLEELENRLDYESPESQETDIREAA
ncbi:hypothetical protein KY349_01655 [Candidatus Woesearchaeota archaeon]|nr:hypothetical protein [Candidatus Woesearchaeota archaeon]